jgi:hypothetical protein
MKRSFVLIWCCEKPILILLHGVTKSEMKRREKIKSNRKQMEKLLEAKQSKKCWFVSLWREMKNYWKRNKTKKRCYNFAWVRSEKWTAKTEGVSHEIFRVLFWHVGIDLGLYKNLWLFLIFSVEPLILYLHLKFRRC